MAARPNEGHWIPGASSLLWQLGHFVVVVSALAYAIYGATWIVGPSGWMSLEYFLVYFALGLPLVVALALLYDSLYPRPIANLGVWPVGVALDNGFRRRLVPRAQLRLVDHRLYVLPQRFGLPSVVTLTSRQATGVRTVVQV